MTIKNLNPRILLSALIGCLNRLVIPAPRYRLKVRLDEEEWYNLPYIYSHKQAMNVTPKLGDQWFGKTVTAWEIYKV